MSGNPRIDAANVFGCAENEKTSGSDRCDQNRTQLVALFYNCRHPRFQRIAFTREGM